MGRKRPKEKKKGRSEVTRHVRLLCLGVWVCVCARDKRMNKDDDSLPSKTTNSLIRLVTGVTRTHHPDPHWSSALEVVVRARDKTPVISRSCSSHQQKREKRGKKLARKTQRRKAEANIETCTFFYPFPRHPPTRS